MTGDSPRAMFNYIRVRPKTPGRYEFRFIPRTGSDIAINSDEGAIFLQLSASAGVIAEDFSTPYGVFRLTMNGNKVSKEQVMFCTEMVTKPKQVIALPPVETTIPTTISNYNWAKVPSSAQFYKNAWLTEFLGSAFNKSVGFKGAASVVKFKPRGAGPEDDGYINVGISATVNTVSGPKHAQLFGTNKNWAGNGAGIQFTVIDDSRPRVNGKGDQFAILVPHFERQPIQEGGSVDGVSRIHRDGGQGHYDSTLERTQRIQW